MASRSERFYTVEEYLALEASSLEKHEYFDGRIYAMSGRRLSHNRVSGNVFGLLYGQFRGRPCEVFGSDMKVRVEASGLYTYPDASAYCGEPRFDRHEQGILLNPTLIVEVLSPSTESYDRGTKFGHYQKMSSLQYYALLAADIARAELFVRAGDQWVLTTYEGLDATVALTALGAELRLADVYDRVELVPSTELRAVHEPDVEYATR